MGCALHIFAADYTKKLSLKNMLYIVVEMLEKFYVLYKNLWNFQHKNIKNFWVLINIILYSRYFCILNFSTYPPSYPPFSSRKSAEIGIWLFGMLNTRWITWITL